MLELKNIKKDEKWLLARLDKEGYDDISKILLLTCDNKEKLTFYMKNVELENSSVLE